MFFLEEESNRIGKGNFNTTGRGLLHCIICVGVKRKMEEEEEEMK